MNARSTLITALIAIPLLVLGYYLLFTAPEPPGQPPRPAPRVFDLTSSQVARLELRDLVKSREIDLVRVDNAWQYEKPTTQIADASRVNDTVDGFAILQASRVFTDVTDLTQYGVLTGTLEARITMRDSTTYGITVGNKTFAGDSYYAIYTGSKQPPLFIIASRLPDEWLGWFDNPPYPPTPTPTAPPTPTASASQTPSATPISPGIVPTILPGPVATPTP